MNFLAFLPLVLACMVCVPAAFAQDLPPPEQAGKDKHPNMDSRLAGLYESAAAGGGAVPASTTAMQLSSDGQRVQVVLVMVSAGAPVPGGLGIEVETLYEDMVQATVPVMNLEKIASDENVRLVKIPSRPVPADLPLLAETQNAGTVTSEGTTVIGSDLLNTAGYTGDGVKVAVIDTGFDVTNPEISGNIAEYRSFSSSGIAGSDIDDSDHGTAVAEIIVDIAPDAELYLYNIKTDVEFLHLVDHIIDRRDIDIVSMSLGWFNDVGPADGTTVLAQKVSEARYSGILWVNSAGNEAERHWQGQFSDTDGDGLHNFQGTDQTIDIGVNAGDELVVVLSWDDWDAPSQDFELCLLEDGVGIGCSDNPQPGSAPVEAVGYEFQESATAQVAIKKYFADRDVNFQLFSRNHDLSQYAVASSSIGIPADSPGSMSVGATRFSDDGLESYSSQGPTLDGRIKPDISGPTGVSTTAYGHVGFPGTSASAPHVAGAAALAMEKYPGATADQVQDLLEAAVDDRHAKSNRDGTGRVDVSMLVGSDILALDNGSRDCASGGSCFFPETLSVGRGSTVTWANADREAITVTSDSSSAEQFDSGPLSRGETYSKTFDTEGTFGYHDSGHTWATGQVTVAPACPDGQEMVGGTCTDLLDTRVSSLETAINAINDRTAAMGDRIDALDTRVSSLETAINAINDRITVMGDSIDALLDVIAELRDQIGTDPPEPRATMLTGTVFTDTDADGTQDPGELGRAGLTVLYVDMADWSKIGRTTTDSTGNYTFSIPAGDYLVQLEGVAAEQVLTGHAYLTVPAGMTTVQDFTLRAGQT